MFTETLLTRIYSQIFHFWVISSLKILVVVQKNYFKAVVTAEINYFSFGFLLKHLRFIIMRIGAMNPKIRRNLFAHSPPHTLELKAKDKADRVIETVM